MLSYNGLTFDPAMRCIHQSDGGEIAFTRQERVLLLELTRRPGTIVSREELAVVLSRTGRSTSVRNVDFLVNRLRQRLGDNARAPRFVGTQYGEGYVWIARTDPVPLDAFIVIGPVRGDVEAKLAREFMRNFSAHLTSFFGRDRPVMLQPEIGSGASTGFDYGIEVTLLEEGRMLHCALAMRTGKGGRIVSTHRAAVGAQSVVTGAITASRWARGAVWRHIAVPDDPGLTAPSDVPLEIRLQEASRALVRPTQMWREGEAQLRQARATFPNDPTLTMLWALNQLSRLIHWPPDPALTQPGAITALEDEIEREVLAHLHHVEDNPLLKLAAAKMLFFINRGHHALAEKLADEAFASSTAFAAAFATRGQLLMCAAQLDEAIRIYDKGLELSAFGSEFQAYLLVLKATALMAADQQQAVARVAEELFTARPAGRELALFFASDPLQLDAGQQAILAALTPEQGRLMLLHLHHTSARHFRQKHHRANVLAGLAHVLQHRFGPEVVPPQLASLLA
ncbi:MAG: winged helix-turn-helix transcriptional regulator [Phyllobacteriaceae bacterium]|nr:winged helix-turn-helix transcriptional regulator [Phyllobacteriaceae bacterium]